MRLAMGVLFGVLLLIAWIAVGLGTDWFGLPSPANIVIGAIGGFLCTAALGPALASAVGYRP